MDVLSLVYDAISIDPFIQEQTAGRIKYYEYPETGAVVAEGAHVIIDPLDVPLPRDFADNKYLTYDILIQIDTWSKSRNTTKAVADKIEAILWGVGLVQVGGLDEYDEKIFRDARRFRGKIYRSTII